LSSLAKVSIKKLSETTVLDLDERFEERLIKK